jgi:hypothetical protein
LGYNAKIKLKGIVSGKFSMGKRTLKTQLKVAPITANSTYFIFCSGTHSPLPKFTANNVII